MDPAADFLFESGIPGMLMDMADFDGHPLISLLGMTSS
jgi:hypothetical protein